LNRILKLAGRTVLLATLIVGAGAGAASASNLTAHYTGLYVYDDNNGKGLVGEIDYTTNANNLVQRIDSDAYGDRMKISVPFRDRAPSNGAGVHVSVNWYKHGDYCYVSGISTNGASNSCSSGWNGYGNYESKNVSDSGWWFVYPAKAYDPYSDSIRGNLHICQAESTADPCSGYRLLGISY
jgi:hypothetical protein